MHLYGYVAILARVGSSLPRASGGGVLGEAEREERRGFAEHVGDAAGRAAASSPGGACVFSKHSLVHERRGERGRGEVGEARCTFDVDLVRVGTGAGFEVDGGSDREGDEGGKEGEETHLSLFLVIRREWLMGGFILCWLLLLSVAWCFCVLSGSMSFLLYLWPVCSSSLSGSRFLFVFHCGARAEAEYRGCV